jgi:PAS domain S-box-containing protein
MPAESSPRTPHLGISPDALDLLPLAAYVCDAEGVIQHYNARAAALWGREPHTGEHGDTYCGALRLFRLDGTPLPHAESPMAEVLRTGQPQRDRRVVIERPDGARITVLANIGPLWGPASLAGALSLFQDVTEPTRLADEPPTRETQLRALVNALPVPIYTTDASGYITLYNDAAAELWGRRPELGREKWCGSYRMFQPNGLAMPLDECPMAQTLRQGQSVLGAEIVVERPDGRRRHVLPHPELLRDESGAIVGAVHLLVDITSQKQAEARIRQSEERFRAIVEATPECVTLIAPDGTLLEMNSAGLAMVEADRPEQVVGRPILSLIAPEHRDAFAAFHEAVCRGERQRLDFEIVGLRGTRRMMHSHAVPFAGADGRWLHLAVTRDLTEQNRADVVRNLLAAIVESSNDAIVSKDLDGTITSWNSGAEHIFGYTAEEVIGKHISIIIPPAQGDDVSLILNRIRRGERVDHYQTKRRTKDGRILDISLSVSPIRDATGTTIGASKVARNITEERQAQEALRRSEEQLREVNGRKDEFLAMLAHELRNPLSAIASAVKLARSSTSNEHREWSNEVIDRQVRQLARLIDDLLDVSRINRGKIQLRKQTVDVGPILSSAVDSVRPLIEERNHTLSIAIGSGALRVHADPVRLEQIVVNLLTNAAKYTECGGHVWLSAEQQSSDVVIQVRDNGIGIAPEKLPQMFELFVQGDRALARSEGGLGIGLTVVKSLVEMHQGTVSATTAGPGRGCEFTVRLPAAVEPRPEPAPAPPSETGSRRASRILVVDDNADAATGLSRLLKLLGHEVRTVNDGHEAIAVATRFEPDVVLLDIGLPGMDGYQVARVLRQQPVCKDSVLIAVTGYGQDDDRRKGREAGFDFHLVKPIDHDALLALLSAS